MKSNISSRARLCVIGDPVSHSLSPVLQNFLIKHFNLSFTYEAVHVAPGELPGFVQRLRANEFAGANVTLPHKQAIISLLDDCAPRARQIGAVNTVVSAAQLLHGHNTDASGFLRAAQAAHIDFKNQQLLVLGAGGAAKAVLHVLLEAGASMIHVCNRDLTRAEHLLGANSGAKELRKKLGVIKWEERAEWLQTKPVTIIINTTSAGMPPQKNILPLPPAVLHENLTVIDLIYNPAETLLLHEAKMRGAKTMNGLPMLIYQGVAALELWSGHKLEVGGIYAQLEQRLLSEMQP